MHNMCSFNTQRLRYLHVRLRYLHRMKTHNLEIYTERIFAVHFTIFFSFLHRIVFHGIFCTYTCNAQRLRCLCRIYTHIHVTFSSVQDGIYIYALGKAHMRFTSSLRSFPRRRLWNSSNVRLIDNRPFKEDRLSLPLWTPLSSRRSVVSCPWLCARR